MPRNEWIRSALKLFAEENWDQFIRFLEEMQYDVTEGDVEEAMNEYK